MKTKTKKQKPIKTEKKSKPANDKFKQRYFDFYDDVKHYTNGKEDW